MKLNILESSCACEKCSRMCHAPCLGTPEDMQKLMDAGFGKRLMFDDWERERQNTSMRWYWAIRHDFRWRGWRTDLFGCGQEGSGGDHVSGCREHGQVVAIA